MELELIMFKPNRDFFGLFYSQFSVIFSFEYSIFLSQSTGKNSKLKVTKYKKVNKNSKIFEIKGYFTVTVFK